MLLKMADDFKCICTCLEEKNGYPPFVTNHTNITVAAICIWFQQIGTRPCGWQIGFRHSPAIAQITLSSVNLCLSLSEVERFCA
jgi:hypothetical protein